MMDGINTWTKYHCTITVGQLKRINISCSLKHSRYTVNVKFTSHLAPVRASLTATIEWVEFSRVRFSFQGAVVRYTVNRRVGGENSKGEGKVENKCEALNSRSFITYRERCCVGCCVGRKETQGDPLWPTPKMMWWEQFRAFFSTNQTKQCVSLRLTTDPSSTLQDQPADKDKGISKEELAKSIRTVRR